MSDLLEFTSRLIELEGGAVEREERSPPAPGPVAQWFLHDRDDDTVSIEMGRAARDVALDRNGCERTTGSAAKGCVTYDGCTVGYPVVWCETQGLGHNIAGDTAPGQVWSFFKALP
jgi:hypothetical protein